MCSNDGEITEIGSNSDEDSSPPTSKREKTHPLQELLGSKFQLNSSSPCATTTVSNKDVILFELARYNTEKPALLTDNPLTWWKEKHANLSLLARKYLGILATSVPSERLFSVAGLVVNNKRASVQPINVEKLVFLHHNLRTSSHIDYNRSKCSCSDCIKL